MASTRRLFRGFMMLAPLQVANFAPISRGTFSVCDDGSGIIPPVMEVPT